MPLVRARRWVQRWRIPPVLVRHTALAGSAVLASLCLSGCVQSNLGAAYLVDGQVHVSYVMCEEESLGQVRVFADSSLDADPVWKATRRVPGGTAREVALGVENQGFDVVGNLRVGESSELTVEADTADGVSLDRFTFDPAALSASAVHRSDGEEESLRDWTARSDHCEEPSAPIGSQQVRGVLLAVVVVLVLLAIGRSIRR